MRRSTLSLALGVTLAWGCEDGTSVVGVAPTTDRAMAAPEPYRVLARRLSVDEVAWSLRDLLGASVDDVAAALPADPTVLGFRDNEAALSVSTPFSERLASAVESIIGAVDWARDIRPRLATPCTPKSVGDACMRSFVAQFGRRVYRRPLTDAEVARYASLAALAGDDVDAAPRVVLDAMLQSPHFLYVVEAPSHTRAGRVDGYTLATRLAYALWGTTPTDALLDQAAAGELDTDEGYARVASAMLDDARAHAGLRRFFGQWLRFDQTAWIVRNAGDYHNRWRPEFVDDYAEETARFADALAFTDGADFRDLVSARWSIVNPRLASLYDVPAGEAPTEGWARVTLPDAEERSGVLTHGGTMAITTWSQYTSATRRGEWVRSVLLCQEIPAPSPNLAPSTGQAPALEIEAIREVSDAHRRNPACSNCHALLDPVGFGLERYDGIGAYRTSDDRAGALTGAGQLTDFAATDFRGAAALGAALRASPRVSSCVVKQLFRYAMRRGEVDADAADLAAVTERFVASGGSFRAMALALVTRDAFVAYHGEPTADGGAP